MAECMTLGLGGGGAKVVGGVITQSTYLRILTFPDMGFVPKKIVITAIGNVGSGCVCSASYGMGGDCALRPESAWAQAFPLSFQMESGILKLGIISDSQSLWPLQVAYIATE